MSAPNILFILSDQHSRHFAGCYGSTLAHTPNLDELAARGTLFENAYCNYPLSCPSRMSFLTGRAPHEIRVWANSSRLSSEIPTFAHALNAAKYETALCGRMHFNGPDQRHGFQQRIFPDSSGFAAGELSGAEGYGRRCIEKTGPGRNHLLLYDTECVAQAQSWLAARGANEAPFCLLVGLIAPHAPYVCPDDLFWKYFERVDAPTCSTEQPERQHPYTRRYREASGGHVSAHEWRRMRAAYLGAVEYQDRLIGELLHTLARSPHGQRTAVVYTSDHGEMAGEHGLFCKMSFYEGSLGVPLLAAWPGQWKEGQRVHAPVSLADLAPTLTELAGAPRLPAVRQSGLLGLLRGEADATPRRVFAELVPDAGKTRGPSGGPSRCLIEDGWKCNYYHGERPELFHLVEDPGELRDQYANPACADRLGRMQTAILADWDPERVAALDRERAERVALIGKSACDPKRADADLWQGPEGYGMVKLV